MDKRLIGIIADTFGTPISWTLDIAGRNYAGSETLAIVQWDGKDADGITVPSGTYMARLTAKPIDDNCSDSKSIQIEVENNCDLKASLTGPGSNLAFGAGGSFPITGSYTTSSSQPVNWTLTFPDGSSKSGTGNDISAIWFGNNATGTLATPGSYEAVLTVTTNNDQCSDTRRLPITVKENPPDQCGLNVTFGSSAHVANGNLSHIQEIFSSRGGALPAGMTLYYNSLDPYNGALGRGWSHSYDASLTENSDGSLLISEPNWKYKYYILQNGAYVAQPGNNSSLTKNADGTFTLTSKDGQVSTFASSGKLASISDRNGNTLNLAHIDDNLASVTDPSGRTVSFAYDAANHLTLIADPSGNAYTFSVAGNSLTSVTQPDGGVWRYTYDANAYMLTKTDPLGNVTTYTYDDQHRVVTSTDPEGQSRSIVYPQTSEAIRSTIFTEKDGGQWSYSYDTQKGTLASKTDPQGGTTSFGYDANGNRTSTTNPDGITTSATYDVTGNMLTSTDAMGQTTTYTYNTFGQVTGISDAQGGTTAYAYDAKGNMTAVTDPAGAITKYEYDTKGNIAKITDPAGLATNFTYDTQGNMATITDASGATSSYTYDNAGNITTITDAKGAVTKYVYDSGNHLFKSIDPNGNATTYSYDANGNKLSDSDANGNITKYEYNSRNQLIKTTDALGGITSYAYGGSTCPSCGGGNGEKLTSLTDAKGNTTSYLYDQLGRLIKETDPLGNSTTYTYDTKDKLISRSDAKGTTVTYSYDPAGRLTGKSYPDGTQESLLYDAGGNLISWQTPNENITYSYDIAKRPLEKKYASLGKDIRYEYDTSGRKSAMIDSEGGRTVYSYDTAGRVAKITDPAGNWASYSYDSAGRRSGVNNSNGTSTTYTYDTAGRLIGMTTNGLSGAISSYQYTYDKVGNRLSVNEAGSNNTTYSYDKLYRLTAYDETRPDASKGTFSYDAVGNRMRMILAKKYLPNDSRSFTYSYNQANQLVDIMQKGRQSPIEITFSYDKNGSLVTQAVTQGRTTTTTSYHYDYLNRLSQVATPDGKTVSIENLADGFNRLSKTTGNETIKYFQDGMSVLGEYDATGSRTARYTLGTGTDEIIAKKDATGTYFYHYDGLGSVTAVTDGTGKVVTKYDYEPFGRMKETSTYTINNAYSFTGREWDKETGLYYYRARYYDPMDGRFIQKDPIGFKGVINLYNYTDSNPVNRTDPTGEAWNGNVVPGTYRQDYVCTVPAAFNFLNDNKCTKQCCKEHDDCYARNGCNASSWIVNGITTIPVGACQMCNVKAAACILSNLSNDKCDDCKK